MSAFGGGWIRLGDSANRDLIIDCRSNPLLATQVAFRCLNGNMSE